MIVSINWTVNEDHHIMGQAHGITYTILFMATHWIACNPAIIYRGSLESALVRCREDLEARLRTSFDESDSPTRPVRPQK